MSNNLSNIFQRGTPRSGGLQGPTLTSAFERSVSKSVNKENIALLLSGGRTTSLFLAGTGKIFQGLDGLSRAKSAFNQAQLLQFDAKSAEIKGDLNAANALELLNDVQATNIVAAFASGIRLQGSAAVVQQVVSSQADFSAALSKANAALVAGGLRRESRQAEDFARRQRKRSLFGAILGAGTLFLSAGAVLGGAGVSSKAITEAQFLA